MNAKQPVCLLDAPKMAAALERLADAVLSACGQDPNLVLIGIRTRGLPLAERLRERLMARLGQTLPLGSLDITLYRDDIAEKRGVPIVRPTEIPFPLKDKTVLLVDDVAYTGRTVRAALDALQDHGRPKRVYYAVLVDRGGRELPIQPDFTGAQIEAISGQRVSVKMRELDQEDGVFLEGQA